MGGGDTYEYRVEFKDGWAECDGDESIIACSDSKLIGFFLNLDFHTLQVEGSLPIRLDCNINDVKHILNTDSEMEVVCKGDRYAWFSHEGNLMLTMPIDAEEFEWMEEMVSRSLKYYCNTHPDAPATVKALLNAKIMCVGYLALFAQDDRVIALVHHHISWAHNGYKRCDDGRSPFALNDCMTLHLLHDETILKFISPIDAITALKDMMAEHDIYNAKSFICEAVSRWLREHPKLNPCMDIEASYHASLVSLGVPYVLRYTEMDRMVRDMLPECYESSMEVVCQGSSDHPERAWCSHEIPTTALCHADIVDDITDKKYVMKLKVLSADPPSPKPTRNMVVPAINRGGIERVLFPFDVDDDGLIL